MPRGPVWSTNDSAFALYADYKGVDRGVLAEYLSRTTRGVSSHLGKLKNPTKYATSQGSLKQHQDAALFEARIRSGEQPDHKQAWDKKVYRLLGKDKEEINGLLAPKEEVEVVTPDVKQEETSESYAPVFSLEVNTNALIAIIKAWRGN